MKVITEKSKNLKSSSSQKRVRRKPPDTIEAKIQFYKDLDSGQLDIAEAIRKMREIVGKTQVDYARMIGIAPRVLIDIERRVRNPTLATLMKIGEPFGLTVKFRKKSEKDKM